MTDILYTHYGPNLASQEFNGYGQWTSADATSVGMDRTVSNGTGYSGQYPPEIASMYESPLTTPDNLLLWFHHVNWTHPVSTGVSVIQPFYNAHYAGALTVQSFVSSWESLVGKVDPERYAAVLYRQKYQAGHAAVWRHSVNEYYYNMTTIPDELGRVNHP